MALWRGYACTGFLALAVGCIFLLEPELPGSALRSLWSSLRLGPAPPGPLSPESRLAAAWDTLIVQPARRWRRVAVGEEHFSGSKIQGKTVTTLQSPEFLVQQTKAQR
nr:ADP-dependent glucokinase-like isoform X2 [Cavia porcellus]